MSEAPDLPEPYKTLVANIGDRVPYPVFSALCRTLIEKGVLTKDEVREIFETPVEAKGPKDD